MLAARLWWLLSVAGHPAPLALEGASSNVVLADACHSSSAFGHACTSATSTDSIFLRHAAAAGGWAAWQAEGRPAELYEPCTLKIASYFESQMQPHLRAELRDVEQLLQQKPQHTLFLDTRSAEQFAGQVSGRARRHCLRS